MVDAGQRTVIPIPVDAVMAPGRGAQVVRMVPISRVRTQDAVSVDGQDRQLSEWSPMPLLGCSPRRLIFVMMLVG